jgi:hypothetical protein
MRWEIELNDLFALKINGRQALRIECFINQQDVYGENKDYLLENTTVKFSHYGKVRYACAYCCIQQQEFKLKTKQSQHRHTLKCTRCNESFDFSTTKRTLNSDRSRTSLLHNSQCQTKKLTEVKSPVNNSKILNTNKRSRHSKNKVTVTKRVQGSSRGTRLAQLAGRKHQVQFNKRLKHQQKIVWRRWIIVGDINWKWHGGFCTVGHTQIRLDNL